MKFYVYGYVLYIFIDRYLYKGVMYGFVSSLW